MTFNAAGSDEPILFESVAPKREIKTDLCEFAPVRVNLRPESRLVFHEEPHSSAADRYRLLRMRLRDLQSKRRLRSMLVTSPLPGDGKSTTVLNLATALAEKGKSKVLVIEADFYHPCLVGTLGIEANAGLGAVLEQGASAAESIRRLEPLGWCLLSAGSPKGNPTELLHQQAFSDLVHRQSLYFDWILIDSPPVIPLADALLLKSHANATLLVARAGHTPRKAIDKALSLIGREHVLGVVLNAAENVNQLYSKYSKYYGNYGGKPAK